MQKPKGKDDSSSVDDDDSENGTGDAGNGYLQVDYEGKDKG